MQQVACSYPEAVHFATESVIANYASNDRSRLEGLSDLLYSLAASIPEAWATSTRCLLSRRENNIDRVIESVTHDMRIDAERSHYLVLSSIFQLALTVKQLAMQAARY